MDLPISDTLWHIFQWVELQKEIHPNEHSKLGISTDDFIEYKK